MNPLKYMVLPTGKLDSFFEALKKEGIVYGPVRAVKAHSFRRVKNLREMDFNYTRTWIPPKKFFTKPLEDIFTFNMNHKDVYVETVEEEKVVVFGVHACDIHAIKLLDRVYMDESPDRYYRVRRENTFLVGLDCVPDEYCFCESLGTNYAYDGFDLFLHMTEDAYLLRVGSLRGNRVIEENAELFKEATASDMAEFREALRRRLAMFSLKLDTNGLLDMLEQGYSHQVWREEADKCFGCGNCNLVCPTCRCYDVVDSFNIDLESGLRTRRWDSCMLRSHGLVAGGLNFRPTRVERLRNRFNCKGSLREGMLNCVGCGRCTVYCPANIDYVQVLKKIRGEP